MTSGESEDLLCRSTVFPFRPPHGSLFSLECSLSAAFQIEGLSVGDCLKDTHAVELILNYNLSGTSLRERFGFLSCGILPVADLVARRPANLDPRLHHALTQASLYKISPNYRASGENIGACFAMVFPPDEALSKPGETRVATTAMIIPVRLLPIQCMPPEVTSSERARAFTIDFRWCLELEENLGAPKNR